MTVSHVKLPGLTRANSLHKSCAYFTSIWRDKLVIKITFFNNHHNNVNESFPNVNNHRRLCFSLAFFGQIFTEKKIHVKPLFQSLSVRHIICWSGIKCHLQVPNSVLPPWYLVVNDVRKFTYCFKAIWLWNLIVHNYKMFTNMRIDNNNCIASCMHVVRDVSSLMIPWSVNRFYQICGLE